MTMMGLVAKNTVVRWWRTLTLGFFVSITGFCIVVFTALAGAIAESVQNVVVHGLTGHIQIKSDQSRETDMVEQYRAEWDTLEPIPAATMEVVRRTAADTLPDLRCHELVRQSVTVSRDGERESVMLMGIEDGLEVYRKAFPLIRGRYLQPGNPGEILLTEELARRFGVDVGDRVAVVTKNRYALNTHADLVVCGVGSFPVLSLFSYNAAYTDIGTMRELIRLEPEEATDVILYADGPGDFAPQARRLAQALAGRGIKTAFSADTRVRSTELKVLSLSEIKRGSRENAGLTVSTYADMGRTYQGMGDLARTALRVFLSLLFVVVFIMTMNLVFLMGFERYREIGTLRAIGMGRGRILVLFMAEILLIAAVFAVVGVALGALAVALVGRSMEAAPSSLDLLQGMAALRPGLRGCMEAFLALVAFAVASSLYPAHRACAIPPAQALRAA